MRVFVAGATGVIGKYPSWRDGFPVGAGGSTSGTVAHDDAA